jgi:hypothetical protein
LTGKHVGRHMVTPEHQVGALLDRTSSPPVRQG